MPFGDVAVESFGDRADVPAGAFALKLLLDKLPIQVMTDFSSMGSPRSAFMTSSSRAPPVPTLTMRSITSTVRAR